MRSDELAALFRQSKFYILAFFDPMIAVTLSLFTPPSFGKIPKLKRQIYY